MITKKQTEDLANYYQIDSFTILREYLQILFLSYLYREKAAGKIYFKGGTAIRLLFDSPRFSEDLDFSCLYSKNMMVSIMGKLEKTMQKELSEIIINSLYFGKNTSRFRLKYNSPDYKYPFVIRLDFNRIKKTEKIIVSPLMTRFPIVVFPLISHLSQREILAEKICAMLTRGKGRDFFDVWYLLEKGIQVDYDLLDYKIRERGERFAGIDIIRKIKSHSQKQLALDLKQFLPKSHRKIVNILLDRLAAKFSMATGSTTA